MNDMVTRKNMLRCHISSYTVTSPIGNLLIKVCKLGLHFLSQSDEIVGDTFQPDKSQEVRIIGSEDEKSAQEQIAYTVRWLHTYFYEIQSLPNLALPPKCPSVEEGTFRGKVWSTLAEHVGPGCTITYGELAKVAGHPGAAQAVGTAMATNPFQIVVPCHRVIRYDGTIGQYARGARNEVKLWLLEHEGNTIINYVTENSEKCIQSQYFQHSRVKGFPQVTYKI